ncbi:MAG TPA: hypothetical protein VNO33_23420 [Kofleriaceae bacterium]|nr:hypothetical protein [Kofleriaceae bacterium]
MNFFGHALAASWRSREPGFALGAMLPDFASMCGMRLEAALDPVAAAGVDYHHATDRVFHRLEPFARAAAEIGRQLTALGVKRGPARGAAHVAFELSLDGALLDELGGAEAYASGLAAGLELEGSLRWSVPDGPARWRSLCERLAAHGLPIEYRDPMRVAERVERVLARRPLLALGAGAEILRREMPAIAARVAGAAPSVLALLRAQLLAQPPGSSSPGSSGETAGGRPASART